MIEDSLAQATPPHPSGYIVVGVNAKGEALPAQGYKYPSNLEEARRIRDKLNQPSSQNGEEHFIVSVEDYQSLHGQDTFLNQAPLRQPPTGESYREYFRGLKIS